MKRFYLSLALFIVLPAFELFASDTIDLSGQWQFAIDSKDIGQKQQWFAGSLPESNTIELPGSIQAQGFGDTPDMNTQWVGDIRNDEWNKPKYAPYRTKDNFKMPFWLQPDKYYKGPAWYQKKVNIPRSWNNKRITLTLERPHWQTTVWVDSQPAGTAKYLSVPHIYDLSKQLTPGEHTLTICVDNREIISIGNNSHSISDHTQSNWNGIVGAIELKKEEPVYIDDVQIYPCLKDKSITVSATIINSTDKKQSGKLCFEIIDGDRKITSHKENVIIESFDKNIEVVIPLGANAKNWDEFNPNLYQLKTSISVGLNNNEHVTTFGMREIYLRDNVIMLNGHRVFMRGTLECCIFPKTGYPPTDVDSWKRIIRICKSHGLNHIRFHSWCPPEAAFIAADEVGFYYQVECSTWCNQTATLGDGLEVDQWVYDEADAILKKHGNHPSFLLFAYGNEPGGKNYIEYLKKWVKHYKSKDSRRLVTSGAGWPMIPENDFHVSPDGTRIQEWGQGLNSRINSRPPETVTDYSTLMQSIPNQAMITHEIGQWCVYPNFEEIKKYTGILKPKNFEIFRDFLAQKHMSDLAHDFLMGFRKIADTML